MFLESTINMPFAKQCQIGDERINRSQIFQMDIVRHLYRIGKPPHLHLFGKVRFTSLCFAGEIIHYRLNARADALNQSVERIITFERDVNDRAIDLIGASSTAILLENCVHSHRF